MRPVTNPVLPGCHPDPSVCRVGDVYYLVVSSFGYYPGIPVYRSTDLVDWELVGHVLDRPGQLDLTGLDLSDGIWASTIRHHDGVFYVVSGIARGRTGASTFVVTATDPAGPWSDPVELDAQGIDPSLFFDDDGRCWFTGARDAPEPAVTGPGELWLRELDLDTLRLVGPEHVLWHGALRGQWVEGPHLYKRDGRYLLLAAEGGTERNHAVTAASATHVTGPYVTDPRSPLLTHRHLGPDHPVQNVGHADLVDTPSGQTWAVVLAVRAVDDTHVLGRETFLVPVEWSTAGPVFAPGAGAIHVGEAATAAPVEVLDLAAPLAAQGWASLRGPVTGLVEPVPDGLLLTPAGADLAGRGTPTFVARRQQHPRFRTRTRLRADGLTGAEQAGVVAFLHQDRFVTHALGVDADGSREVRVTAWTSAGGHVLGRAPLPGDSATLLITGDDSTYTFALETGAEQTVVAAVDRAFLSTEVAGGFLGVHLGVFADGASGPSTAQALVEAFSYEPLAAPRQQRPGPG
ncbi:glycoside hydrolase family 43 protein [Cellulomonas fengjieae]|uniref:Family 43 glycosylhydrolase n=1 Tax=Cellulomonas fengjieae TaxID=2819978 RepID=A0ABS3SEJ1_9CELL|nr:glycoside hydrolase family 43 protein [Cellulomonas fengjieae]MBO3083734.1 family 43 glycosylhydrolase [Cellulomonas fengjieae]QVI64967.1 family 43 glycosylhydrolase [Cellulomonas fengjieae]